MKQPLIELRKENSYLRMDAANYCLFRRHLGQHFVSDDPLYAVCAPQLRYAEFAARDLYTISPFFGMSVSSPGILLLSAFSPRDLSFYREHTFRMYLGVVVGGRLQRRPLVLKYNK